MVTLFARVTVCGERAEISLNRKVTVELWDDGNLLRNQKKAEAIELNKLIDLKRQEIRECYYQLKTEKKEITATAIKNRLLGVDEEASKSLLEVFKYHNDQVKGLIGKDFALTTYKKFCVTYNKVAAFIKFTYKKSDLLLSALNYKFITDFEYYLKTEDKLSNNSTMSYIKNLKKIVILSVKNEWIKKNPFAAYTCRIEETEKEILHDRDIELLKAKKFPSIRLEQVRDIFLFSCYTGYAYSDVLALNPSHIGIGLDGERWIFTKRMKTDNRSNVMLLPEALALIEKYKDHPDCVRKDRLFPVRSNQKYNDYLKEVADLCGINIPLTTHIARHTFATTITLANDVPIESVSSMLGHKSLRSTQVYAKIAQKKLSNDMKALRERLSKVSQNGERKLVVRI